MNFHCWIHAWQVAHLQWSRISVTARCFRWQMYYGKAATFLVFCLPPCHCQNWLCLWPTTLISLINQFTYNWLYYALLTHNVQLRYFLKDESYHCSTWTYRPYQPVLMLKATANFTYFIQSWAQFVTNGYRSYTKRDMTFPLFCAWQFGTFEQIVCLWASSVSTFPLSFFLFMLWLGVLLGLIISAAYNIIR